MMKKNISKTLRDKLCLGCGVCRDICPKGCITIEHGTINKPVVKNNSCNDCGRCLKACAGLGININERACVLFDDDSVNNNVYLGRYIACYTGYSNNYDIRYHCAAGGCLSQFLIWLLAKGVIDGAVVTRFRSDSPMTPQPFIARTKEEILSGKSSKYCVVSLDGVLTAIKKEPGRYVVVGLPCHVQAIRKCIDIDRELKERIIGCFSIYCSSNKTMDSQKYLLYRYGVNEINLGSFVYRDNGCLGSMYFRDDKGENIVKPINYLDYYRGMRSFFSLPRCGQCNDFFGELADVSFGDFNTGKKDDDPIGINSLITRSRYWNDLLIECQNDGALSLASTDEEKMINAQAYCKASKKGAGFYAQRNLWLFLKKPVPEYDNLFAFSPSLIAYLNVLVTTIMRFVGKHPSLWFIIRLLDKNKNN